VCGGFIHLFPTYRKSWNRCKDFVGKKPKEEYTYKDFFIQNTHLGIFFKEGKYYPKGFLNKVWYYWGSKTGWLVEYKRNVDESLEDSKKILERCFTPKLQKMLGDKKNGKRKYN